MIHPTIVITLILVAFALGIILTTLGRNYCDLQAAKSQKVKDWDAYKNSNAAQIAQNILNKPEEITFIAPIDMKPGDDVDIEKEECGHWIVTKIIRDYKTIWKRKD